MLRIFTGHQDRYEGKALFEHIVLKAKELHLAGVTVTRGIMGYGAHSKIHSAKILRLSEDLPIIIEIVDTEENLDKILPCLEECISDGFATIEKVNVIRYRSKDGDN